MWIFRMPTSQISTTLKHAAATLVLLTSFAASGSAGQLEDARAAFDNGDYISALRLYLPLAKQDNAEAQDAVGTLYTNYIGDPSYSRDYVAAVTWYKKAARQGYAPAEANLGSMYRLGLGAPKDLETAVTWFRRGATQGNRDAQFSLAEMYENGEGVSQDFVIAYMWYDLAATAASFDRASIRRDGLARKLTPAQIVEAQGLARDWKATRPTTR